MPERVCRISWRKGRPLSLSISPRQGFLDLPREVRDKVYCYSLSASEPIIVWHGRYGWDDDKYDSSGSLTMRSWKTVKAKSATLDHLALSLLSCNRQVSHEAASILYRWNTFRFTGDQNWSPLYAFLQRIGEESRDSLRSLELQMPQPQRVWQYPDGTRTSLTSWPFREVIAQSAYLQSNSPPCAEGKVDHLDPAIEACFRILGKNRSSLSLVLLLDMDLLPGLTMFHDPHSGEDWDFSLDLPVVIEKCRQELTADSGATSKVEVLWKGECLRDRSTSQTKLIQDKGWVILDAKEGYIHHDRYPKFTMLFTLRRIEDSVASSIRDSG